MMSKSRHTVCDWSILWIYSLFFSITVSLVSTPGPNGVMVMTSGLNFGYKNTIPHLLGISIGYPLMIIIVGLGFGVFLEQFPEILMAIKIIGGIYLTLPFIQDCYCYSIEKRKRKEECPLFLF
jgi:threonine/homoserine/homoserine lactone efflux protein